jgi:hypothetical protein
MARGQERRAKFAEAESAGQFRRLISAMRNRCPGFWHFRFVHHANPAICLDFLRANRLHARKLDLTDDQLVAVRFCSVESRSGTVRKDLFVPAKAPERH